MQENKVSVGENESKIEEHFPDNTIKEINQKEVKIYNEQSVPCFLRVKLLWSDDAAKKKATVDIDQTKWEYSEQEECYYYKEVLEPKKEASFCSTIRMENPTELDNFSVTVYEETYQQGGFSSAQYKEAFSNYEKNRGTSDE